jgi:hypothetical protein
LIALLSVNIAASFLESFPHSKVVVSAKFRKVPF